MKKSNVVMEGDSEVKKEGEMTVSDSDTAAPAVALQPTRHPLENAWTFCFDNPLAKSRQAVWGSSIRPVYTFSSVEDFWRNCSNTGSLNECRIKSKKLKRASTQL